MPTSTNTEIPFLACCTYRYIVTYHRYISSYRILHTSKKPSPATLVVGFRSVDLVNLGFFKTGGGVLFLGKKTTDALKRFVWILMYFDVFWKVTPKSSTIEIVWISRLNKTRPSKSSPVKLRQQLHNLHEVGLQRCTWQSMFDAGPCIESHLLFFAHATMPPTKKPSMLGFLISSAPWKVDF